jgi:3-deoxy-D-manno-octulosonate 8-phosphate phosphatase (KDO 8-P phosphatase)
MHDIAQLAKDIKLLILDVDGVCTDGRLYFNDQGECMKAFHVHDGLGIKLLQQRGIVVAIITSRQSKALEQRLAGLEVEHVYQGYENKILAYEKLLETLKLTDEQVAYVGDDLPDLPVMQRVKCAIAVKNAHAIVKENAHWTTTITGGEGAVREVCDLLIQANTNYDDLFEAHLGSPS